MLEQKDGSNDNPYQFNAKELDEDTGLYYYGARYYNPRLSIWYGVDPLAEKMPSWSPYEYCFSNPINLIDPTGMSAEPPVKGIAYFKDDTGEYFWNEEKDKYEHYSFIDDKKTSTSFTGYYDASEFKEPVGKYEMYFNGSGSPNNDKFNPEHTIGFANDIKDYLLAREKISQGNFNAELTELTDNEKYPGVKIYSSKFMNGALTAGNVIFTNPDQSDDETLTHEYGHYLDFKYHFEFSKVGYMKTIALPSVISAAKAKTQAEHHNSPSEKRANILGGAYKNIKLFTPKK